MSSRASASSTPAARTPTQTRASTTGPAPAALSPRPRRAVQDGRNAATTATGRRNVPSRMRYRRAGRPRSANVDALVQDGRYRGAIEGRPPTQQRSSQTRAHSDPGNERPGRSRDTRELDDATDEERHCDKLRGRTQ